MEEQVWIQAARSLDTPVQNDDTHRVGGSQTVSVTRDYSGAVAGTHTQATQLAHEQLVGGGLTQKVQGALVQASDSGIVLVAGKSVLTLGANGTVTLQCENFSIDALSNGEINTGGTLDLNITRPESLPTVEPTPAQIQAAVKAAFNQGTDK